MAHCLLCRCDLAKTLHDGILRHPDAVDCRVTYTDRYGVSLSDEQIKIVETMIDTPPAEPEPPRGLFDVHPPVDYVAKQLFDLHQLPRLGGVSTGRGWSSYSLAQRCLYAFNQRYGKRIESEYIGELENLAVGTMIHTFLALHYANLMGEYEAITPELCREFMVECANPKYVNEGWRVFNAYRLYYANDDFEPLAVEYDLRDPRTGESCRYDVIWHKRRSSLGMLAGTYIGEHKSASRFDADTLDSWANDGEIIGEAALWHRLGLDKRFGKLRGVIVNLLGKQKDPKFHRTVVAPDQRLIDAHFSDLAKWDSLIALARSANHWPRSRANCVNRYGRCQWFEHCATGAD